MFYKFPKTPYLSDAVRDGMSVSEQERFLSHEVVLEEKVDGANLGIEIDGGVKKCYNRGHYIDFSGQWRKLPMWLETLDFDDKYILFGEWCYAKHTIVYDSLPDWFLGFDVWDKETKRFLGISKRNDVFKASKLEIVPFIAKGVFRKEELRIGRSRFGKGMAEGIYLRYEEDGWLKERAKLVKKDFIQGGHWSKGRLVVQQRVYRV